MGEMWVFSAQDLIPNEQCKDLTFEKLLLDQILFGHFIRVLEAICGLGWTFWTKLLFHVFPYPSWGKVQKTDGKTWHGPMTDLNNGSHDDQPGYFRVTAPVTQTCMTNQDKQKSGSFIWLPLQTQIGLRPRNLRYTNDSRPILEDNFLQCCRP